MATINPGGANINPNAPKTVNPGGTNVPEPTSGTGSVNPGGSNIAAPATGSFSAGKIVSETLIGQATYIYVCTDLVTGTLLGEVSPNTIELDCQLNQPGNMNATFNMDDPRIANWDLINRTQPGRTAFWAYRNNVIVWGGIIWTREYTSVTKTLTLTGQTFESYATVRYPRSWIGTATWNWNDGQMHIIRDLWDDMQGVKYGSIGVITPSNDELPAQANDINRQFPMNGYDLSYTVDNYIQDIVTLVDGPDYTIDWEPDSNGLPKAYLKLGLPIGRPVSQTNFVLDYPGNVLDYDFNENAASGANQWWAQGDAYYGNYATNTQGNAVNSQVPTAVAVNTASLKAGWPLIEGVETYSGVTLVPTLQSYASADVTNYPMPLVTHVADIAGQGPVDNQVGFPEFGTYKMGDYVVFNILDPRYPNGYSFTKRVIGWTIMPPDSGAGVETITLVFYDMDPSTAPGTQGLPENSPASGAPPNTGSSTTNATNPVPNFRITKLERTAVYVAWDHATNAQAYDFSITDHQGKNTIINRPTLAATTTTQHCTTLKRNSSYAAHLIAEPANDGVKAQVIYFTTPS